MKRLRSSLAALLAVFLFAVPAAAIQERHAKLQIPAAQLLSAVALNGAAETRTFTFTNPGGGYAKAMLAMARTRVAGTDLSMTCTRTNTAGVAAKTQRCVYGSTDGICTHYDESWLKTSSTTETITWEIEVLGFVSATCVVASTSAGGTDLLTVTGDLVTQ